MDVSVLLDKKKFRAFNNKEGAVRGFTKNGLGTLEDKPGGRGSNKVNNTHMCPSCPYAHCAFCYGSSVLIYIVNTGPWIFIPNQA